MDKSSSFFYIVFLLQEGSAKFVDTLRSSTKQLQKVVDKLPRDYVRHLVLFQTFFIIPE